MTPFGAQKWALICARAQRSPKIIWAALTKVLTTTITVLRQHWQFASPDFNPCFFQSEAILFFLVHRETIVHRPSSMLEPTRLNGYWASSERPQKRPPCVLFYSLLIAEFIRWLSSKQSIHFLSATLRDNELLRITGIKTFEQRNNTDW